MELDDDVPIHFHEAREILPPAFSAERLPYSREEVFVRLVFGHRTGEFGIHLSPVRLNGDIRRELKDVVNHQLRINPYWIRRFDLVQKQTSEDIDPSPSPLRTPLLTSAKGKIDELGFHGLAQYSQYLTEVDPTRILDIAYAMHRAVPRRIEPNPIKTLADWKNYWVTKDFSELPAVAAVQSPETTFVSLREIIALTEKEKSVKAMDQTTVILAMLMRIGIPEFQPRRRILVWANRLEETTLGKGFSLSSSPVVKDPLPWLLEYVVPALGKNYLAALLFITLCGLETGQGVVERMIGSVGDFRTNYSESAVTEALELATTAISDRRPPEI